MFVALFFTVIGATAYFIRRRRPHKGRAPVPGGGQLEAISTLVAILGTLVAIGGQVIKAPPARQATIIVRDVMPRITRSHFDRRIGDEDWAKRDPIDRREVGNVVLLELQLTGYKGKRLELRAATYSLDRDVRGTLLRGTTQDTDLPVRDDSQTSFVPVWLGYPTSETFEAQFRLIEAGKIRQLSNTGPMRGSKYRYACSKDVKSS